MFNPDSPNEKKQVSATNPPRSEVTPMSEKDRLRFYILEGGMASCYGFRLTLNKKLEIADRNKLLRFDVHTRSVLTELYEENKKKE